MYFFSFRLAEKKAAIGFTYEDNNAACPAIKEEEEDDSSDTDVETADLGRYFVFPKFIEYKLNINLLLVS